MAYNSQDIRRIHTVLDYHVGKDRQNKPVPDQVRILEHRKRRFFFIAVINVLALIFFGYWFFSDMTELPNWVFLVLAVVFLLNLVSVGYQKKQVGQAIDFLMSGSDQPGG